MSICNLQTTYKVTFMYGLYHLTKSALIAIVYEIKICFNKQLTCLLKYFMFYIAFCIEYIKASFPKMGEIEQKYGIQVLLPYCYLLSIP